MDGGGESRRGTRGQLTAERGAGCSRFSSSRAVTEGSAMPTSRSAAAAFDQRPSRAYSSARSARAAAAASADRDAAADRRGRGASLKSAPRSPR